MLDLIEPITINGRSGLDILLNTWCENAETFQGFWPARISTLALTQLFLSDRPSIRSTIVKGDMILKAETRNGESTSQLVARFSQGAAFVCTAIGDSYYDPIAHEDK